MSSLFGSFRLPEQLSQNLPRPQPWKPKNKTAAPDPNKGARETAGDDKKPGGLKEADDILEVSADEFDDDTTVASKDQKVAAEGANGTEEQKKKKNRRKKRTRKQKQQLLQKQILERHGKCTCECHSDLAIALAKAENLAKQEAAGESPSEKDKGGGASVGTSGVLGNLANSKAVGWSGCSLGRGC